MRTHEQELERLSKMQEQLEAAIALLIESGMYIAAEQLKWKLRSIKFEFYARIFAHEYSLEI